MEVWLNWTNCPGGGVEAVLSREFAEVTEASPLIVDVRVFPTKVLATEWAVDEAKKLNIMDVHVMQGTEPSTEQFVKVE